jgi:predicted aspartyl protease
VAHGLFDSGASYSFVSEDFVSRAGLSVQRLGHLILVSSPNGSISSCSVCQECSVILADEAFSANLVVISLGAFDVILGMDWCWGPSASEGPQKHDLTVFLEYNV